MCVCNGEAGIDIPPPRVHRSRLKRLINFHSVMGCEGKKEKVLQRSKQGRGNAPSPSHTFTHTNCTNTHTCMHLEMKLLLDRSWKKQGVCLYERVCVFDKLRMLKKKRPLSLHRAGRWCKYNFTKVNSCNIYGCRWRGGEIMQQSREGASEDFTLFTQVNL